MNTATEKIVQKIAEVQARQAQNKVEQASNKDNSDKLGEEMARLTKELAESKKPKATHGDYGYSDRQETTHLVISDSAGALRWSDFTGGYYGKCVEVGDHASHFVCLGNIFDDLTALQEDVKEFEIKSDVGYRIGIKGEIKGNAIFIKQEHEGVKKHLVIDPDILPAFILNLRQMQSTLKRQESKK
jgi:hypothetical protein